jgi:DNA-binding response OmpR family regulator
VFPADGSGQPTNPLSSTLRILLVEDHASTNAVLTRLLGAHYTVHSATTAAQALELARSEAIDLVIADIGLPDETGWDLLKKIRPLRPNVHAIALTGVDYSEDPVRFSEAGFDMHLPKPVELSKIISAITTLCPEHA